MLFGPVHIAVANFLDKKLPAKVSRKIQMPLWDCLICMSGIWTIILTKEVDVPLIMTVCGINALIDKILNYEGGIDRPGLDNIS